MKFVPLLSAVSFGASAAILAVDTVEHASAPDLGDLAEAEDPLVKRGRGSGSGSGSGSGGGSDSVDRNPYGGEQALGTGKTRKVSKDSYQVKVAGALAGSHEDALRANEAEGPRSQGRGVIKLKKRLPDGAYTGETAIYKEWNPELGDGAGGYDIHAYEGGTEVGGASSANNQLYNELGGKDVFNPPPHRRATKEEIKQNRAITRKARTSDYKSGNTLNEDQLASTNTLDDMPRIVNAVSTRESNRQQAPLARAIARITKEYPHSRVYRIPNALPEGTPISHYVLGPYPFDNWGYPMMPDVIYNPNDADIEDAGEGITEYTGTDQPKKVYRKDGTSYEPGVTGPEYVPPKRKHRTPSSQGSSSKGSSSKKKDSKKKDSESSGSKGSKGSSSKSFSSKAKDSKSDRKGKGKATGKRSAAPVFSQGLKHKPLLARQLPSMPSTAGPSGANLTAQYEEALQDDFDWITGLQNNITDLIWPILLDLTYEAQESEIYIMAMSIWSDLTGGPLLVGSPYWNGMTTLMDLTPTTPEDAVSQAYLVNSYQDAWDNASALVSAAGYDVTLEGFFNLTDINDTSLLPPTPSNWNETLDQLFAAFWPAATDNSTEPIYTSASPEFQAWNHSITALFLNSTNLTDLLPPSARPNITVANLHAVNSTGTDSTGANSAETNSTGTNSTGSTTTTTNSTGTSSTGTNSTGSIVTATDITGTNNTGTNSTGVSNIGNSSTAINQRRWHLARYRDRQF